MTSRRAQGGELISATEQMLKRGETDHNQIEPLLEFQTTHITADHPDCGISHASFTKGQHCLGRIHGGHMTAVLGKGNGETPAASSQLKHPLPWRSKFSEHLDVVSERSEI